MEPLWANFAVFAVAGVIVWIAGSKLATYADVIAERTGLGRAFLGLLLLATATSLPELATTITAGVIGNANLLTGNLLGGIAMQTAILAVMDLLLVQKAPLTFFAPNPKLLIHGVMVVALLSLVMIGTAVDSNLKFWSMGPMPVVIAVLFLLMIWMTHPERTVPQWEALNPPEEKNQAEGDEETKNESLQRQEQRRYRETKTRRLYLLFAGGAAVILAAGYLLARAGDAIAKQTGLGSTLVGAVLVAIATSLPEISTTAKAVRLGAYGMAISNIFGSNAFCVALLLVGDVAYREGPILSQTSRADLLLSGLGILVTCTYLWGMLERRNKTFLKMGIDSGLVLLMYLGGMALLYRMGRGGSG